MWNLKKIKTIPFTAAHTYIAHYYMAVSPTPLPTLTDCLSLTFTLCLAAHIWPNKRLCPRELILRMCYFFRKCLGDCNIECWLQCISSFSDCVSVTKFVHAHAFRCVIGIHAWRAGRLLLGLRKFKLIYIFLTIKGIGTSFWFVWVDQNWLWLVDTCLDWLSLALNTIYQS